MLSASVYSLSRLGFQISFGLDIFPAWTIAAIIISDKNLIMFLQVKEAKKIAWHQDDIR